MSSDVFLKRYARLGREVDPTIRTGPSLRVNTLLIDDAKLVARLTARGVLLEKIPFAKHGYWIRRSHFSLGSTTEYLRGLYYIQDASPQIPVQVLDPKPGDVVLDCCAAPGGKTTQLAQWMDNKGIIVAFEKNNDRIISLKSNIERCGVLNSLVFNADAASAPSMGAIFDKILLDAPCAGNFASDPRWFEKRTVGDAKQNAPIQQRLLQAASQALKPGGVMVYSTCSLEPEENEMMVDWAVRNLPLHCVETGLSIGQEGITNPLGFTLDAQIKLTRRFWPEKDSNEGFFVARMVKDG